MKVWPGNKLPLLKEPSSAVTVWVTESLLVQVTVVPDLTVIVLGLKARPAIETEAEVGAVGVDVEVVGVVGVGVVGAGVVVTGAVGVVVGTVTPLGTDLTTMIVA